ncbi:cytochrome P450 1A1-like [Mercenaria mercenaria]|uniref:cytochrome P450 1A1-like n=1 Tax=Mercenaria mercenaria TaxID=6596 RepID=UPI00234EABAF|nr:cytochrome P450 1A1-like [Mercenaria mercenaria]
MSALTTVLGILSTAFLTFLFIKWVLQTKGKRYPRGPMGLPVVGHLPFFGRHPPSTFMKWWKSYGNVFSIRLGSWNTVVVNGYKAIKVAAEHPNDTFSGKPNFVSTEVSAERIHEDVFAFGNFSPVYLKQRNLASKALRLFTSKRKDVIEELVTNEAVAFADSLIRKYSTNPGYIEIEVQTLVVRIIYQFLYGRGKQVDVDRHVEIIYREIEEFNEFTGSGSAIDVLPWLRYIMPWKVDALRKIIAKADDIMWKQVQEHYESFSADHICLNRIYFARGFMKITQYEMGIGADTTSITLLWLILYMTKFPQIQERVFAEINTVIGKSRNVELKDKPNLFETARELSSANNLDTLTKSSAYIINVPVSHLWARSRKIRANVSLALQTKTGTLVPPVDTASKTLLWLILYMTKFPQIQERVFAETKTVIGKSRNVELKDKPNLVYTNAVILEVMRIVTQVPFSLPHFSMTNAKIEGLDVDTAVLFNLYSIHHEKEFWGDPEYFRPERFILGDNTLDSDKCNHVLAFGLGRRRCVGEFLAKMNVFLAFSIVMQRCKFIKPPGERLGLSPLPRLVYTCKEFKVLVQERK